MSDLDNTGDFLNSLQEEFLILKQTKLEIKIENEVTPAIVGKVHEIISGGVFRLHQSNVRDVELF